MWAQRDRGRGRRFGEDGSRARAEETGRRRAFATREPSREFNHHLAADIGNGEHSETKHALFASS